MALAGQVVFRVIAACLAFIPAMVFGIAAVNKYYDYYQTWGALYSDLSGQTTSIPHLTAAGLGKGTAGSVKQLIGHRAIASSTRSTGCCFSATIAGRRSHISGRPTSTCRRSTSARRTRTTGSPPSSCCTARPGEPSAWVNVMNVVPIYLQAMAERQGRRPRSW